MFKIVQWTDSTVYPKYDRIFYDVANGYNGIVHGCEITHLGSNQIRVAQGFLLIKGALVEVAQTDVMVELSSAGAQRGQMWVRLNLSDSTPIQLMSEAASQLSVLTQDEDCNFSNGIYELQLCEYDVSETAISNLDITAEKIPSQKDMFEMFMSMFPISYTGTLPAGETTITFSDERITDNSTYEGAYTSIYGVNPTDVVIVNGSITLTFDAQDTDITVEARVI